LVSRRSHVRNVKKRLKEAKLESRRLLRKLRESSDKRIGTATMRVCRFKDEGG
jgi:RNase adaptor protein for sRNA GlmZ degradation